MIIRVARVRAHEGKVEELKKLIQQESIADNNAQAGLIQHYAGAPLTADGEFVMVTIWEDMEALKRSVGEDWEKTQMSEKERALIAETMEHHYERIDEDEDWEKR